MKKYIFSHKVWDYLILIYSVHNGFRTNLWLALRHLMFNTYAKFSDDNKVHCDICKKIVDDEEWHLHHQIPKSFGGTDDPTNLSLLCKICHETKTQH